MCLEPRRWAPEIRKDCHVFDQRIRGVWKGSMGPSSELGGRSHPRRADKVKDSLATVKISPSTGGRKVGKVGGYAEDVAVVYDTVYDSM